MSQAQKLSNKFVLDQIEREVDAEFEQWLEDCVRQSGWKATPRQKLNWYRERLLREIYERRRGIR